MRYFGMTDMNEIDRMTLGEYFMRMEAAMLRNNDQEKLIHLQAWASQMVQATEGSKKHPKPNIKRSRNFTMLIRLKRTLLINMKESRLQNVMQNVNGLGLVVRLIKN